jgi:hypothetical protein
MPFNKDSLWVVIQKLLQSIADTATSTKLVNSHTLRPYPRLWTGPFQTWGSRMLTVRITNLSIQVTQTREIEIETFSIFKTKTMLCHLTQIYRSCKGHKMWERPCITSPQQSMKHVPSSFKSWHSQMISHMEAATYLRAAREEPLLLMWNATFFRSDLKQQHFYEYLSKWESALCTTSVFSNI